MPPGSSCRAPKTKCTVLLRVDALQTREKPPRGQPSAAGAGAWAAGVGQRAGRPNRRGSEPLGAAWGPGPGAHWRVVAAGAPDRAEPWVRETKTPRECGHRCSSSHRLNKVVVGTFIWGSSGPDQAFNLCAQKSKPCGGGGSALSDLGLRQQARR